MSVRVFLSAIVVLICAFQARAADVQIDQLKDDIYIISVVGEFKEGDDNRFKNLAISTNKAVVFLDSPGGLAGVGMEIGRTISIKGFSTAVAENTICASSCGLVWLAGKHRFITPTSKVGFHAVFSDTSGQQTVSSAGNALVGSYLQQLGLSANVIVYVTDAAPASMQWLTAADAKQIGLDIDLLAGDAPAQASAPVPFGGDAAASYAPTTVTVTPPVQPQAPLWRIFEHTDLPGYDLPEMPLKLFTVEDCKIECDGNERCRAFTFNETHNVCFLKGMATEALQFSGAVSGYKGDAGDIMRVGQDFGPALDFRTSKNVEIMGKPFAKFSGSSLAACQDQCVITQSCQGFNYYRSGMCVMLNVRKPTRNNLLSVAGARSN
ncbi:PAN domain-containing protein [Rhizobium sp. PRIMUS64]|uniref:PAN domain-containing protein n=1 Tax=Rhizobium sp. PRIMUS64 TaxID=2908925 RepID=UPI001FF22E6B|nr:PAN domain-containing protein [Rhizobium sp. PRIMUS64]MCJ9696623.1 PAN domain-containing protein [Rhizobium sp. PRIMUS64]